MNFTKHIILFIFLATSAKIQAQQFWSLTYEFWGGPKTGIVLVEDSVFIISTNHSVLLSTNECNQLDLVLSASEIHTVFASKNGKLIAGGTGKIFISNDFGLSWDSVSINTGYPLKQIIENSYGELFAITGIFDDGDGVFYSGDEGLTWQKRNNGLVPHLGCAKIAVDKYDRLYLAITDENTYGFGGLFLSEDNGIQWEKTSINIDSIGNNIRIGIVTNLSVLKNDSIYLSFYGSGENYGVELNTYKSINDVNKTNSWKVLNLKHNKTWGMDDAMNNIYIAKNGDWYSSTSGTISSGGTCFSKDAKNWNVIDYGLGADIYGGTNEQFFVENNKGRVFMIQYLDERIYQTDKSLVTGIDTPARLIEDILIYPNPVLKNEKIKIQMNNFKDLSRLSIYDYSGKKNYSDFVHLTENEITAPSKEGIYIVNVVTSKSKQSVKILVQ